MLLLKHVFFTSKTLNSFSLIELLRLFMNSQVNLLNGKGKHETPQRNRQISVYIEQENCNAGKYGPEKTRYLDTFHAVCGSEKTRILVYFIP